MLHFCLLIAGCLAVVAIVVVALGVLATAMQEDDEQRAEAE